MSHPTVSENQGKPKRQGIFKDYLELHKSRETGKGSGGEGAPLPRIGSPGYYPRSNIAI